MHPIEKIKHLKIFFKFYFMDCNNESIYKINLNLDIDIYELIELNLTTKILISIKFRKAILKFILNNKL